MSARRTAYSGFGWDAEVEKLVAGTLSSAASFERSWLAMRRSN